MIKACVFDLDGTIISKGALTISPHLKDVFKELINRNIILIFNTSRGYDEIKGFNKCFLNYFDGWILSTGAEVVRNLKVCKKHPIKAHRLQSIIEYLDNNQILYAYSLLEHKFYLSQDPLVANVPSMDHYFTNGNVIRKIEVEDEIIDFYFFGSPEQRRKVASIATSDLEILDLEAGSIRDRSVTKASGLIELCKAFMIEPNECMVFGDGDNDIPMFEMDVLSVAMENATERLKEVAKMQCGDIHNDGVAKFLEDYFMQGE